MKILLLNPPGRFAYQRDYYCSKVAKAGNLFHPTDLLILSGRLASRHQLVGLDALAEGLSPASCLARIAAFDPEVVISLCGAVSWQEDQAFFEALKQQKPGLRLMVSGDLVLEGPAAFPESGASVDALLLDFTTDAALDWVEGGRGEDIPDVFYRHAGAWCGHLPERASGTSFSIPVPRHELFPERLYRFPLLRQRPFATLLTDYGCRYHCSFCATGNLGYKWRPVANVIEELDVIAGRGIRELYVNDQTFGLERPRTEALLRAMVDKRYGFGWACWCRADRVDRELLALMRQAGCHTLMLGAEAADADALAAANKGFHPQDVTLALELCRQAGMRTLVTFLLGLPGQDRAACLRTIDFACRCGCDFASFNVPVPRMTTALRRQAFQQGWIDSGDLVFDQSGVVAAMGNGLMSAQQVMALRRQAVRAFYLRPGYLARQLATVRRPADLLGLIRFGLATLR